MILIYEKFSKSTTTYICPSFIFKSIQSDSNFTNNPNHGIKKIPVNFRAFFTVCSVQPRDAAAEDAPGPSPRDDGPYHIRSKMRDIFLKVYLYIVVLEQLSFLVVTVLWAAGPRPWPALGPGAPTTVLGFLFLLVKGRPEGLRRARPLLAAPRTP